MPDKLSRLLSSAAKKSRRYDRHKVGKSAKRASMNLLTQDLHWKSGTICYLGACATHKLCSSLRIPWH